MVMLVVVLAGCLRPAADGAPDGVDAVPPAPVPPPDFDFSTAIEGVHDHSDPALHTGAFDVDLLGHDVLASADPTMLPGGYTEVSLAAGYAYVSNWGPHRAFSIVDASDPARPVHVSDFAPNRLLDPLRPGGGSYWDVSAFPEGDLVVSSAQALAIVDGGADELGGGLYLVNVTDKQAPYLESFTQVIDPDALVPAGVHNARPFRVGGERFVAATTANGQTYLFLVAGEAGARTLEQVAAVPGVHDTTVQVHPVTGETLLYGANGGVVITDVSDPRDPEVISVLPNAQNLSAYHLIVPSDVLVEGRHYTVSGTEDTQGDPQALTVIDTTDPRSPFVVSTWRVPFPDLALPGAYRYTTHNFDVDHGRIYLGHYHAGVWVIDISSVHNAHHPVTLGYYQPHAAPPQVPRTPLGADVPAVWSVVRHDGVVWAADVNTGLYALTFTGTPSPLEDAPTWPTNLG